MPKSAKRFLLAYHDVCWDNCALVDQELRSLAALGFPRWSLLIVPDAPLEQIPAFRMWLLLWQTQGHELVLHGWKHKAQDALARGFAGRVQLCLTQKEAEFAGLSYADCKAMLEEAVRAWERLELGRAIGFVPPTWHAPDYLCELALKVGWNFYETRFAIAVNGEKGCCVFSSVPVSFAGLPTWVQWLSLRFGGSLARQFSQFPRLALHPGEFSGLLGLGIQKLLLDWGKSNTPILYEELSKVSTFGA